MGARTGTALPGSRPQSPGCLHPQGPEFPAWGPPRSTCPCGSSGQVHGPGVGQVRQQQVEQVQVGVLVPVGAAPRVGSGHRGPAHLSRARRPPQHCRSWPPAHRPAGTYLRSVLRREEDPRDHLSSRHNSVPHQAAVLGQHPVQVPDLVLQVFLVAPREVPAIR